MLYVAPGCGRTRAVCCLLGFDTFQGAMKVCARVGALLVITQAALAFLHVPQVPATTTARSSVVMEAEKGMSRGDALKGLGAAALVAPWVLLGSAGVRAADDTQTFKDNKYPVSFSSIPSAWQRTDTRVGSDLKDFRRLVVFKDPNSEANAFVAFTDIRPDFTTLGSFGTIRDVAKTVIPTGREVESALLRAENIKGGFYLYEYTVQPPRQPKRHLQTIFALIPGEVLVTYTASCLESDYEALQPTFDAITKSFNIE